MQRAPDATLTPATPPAPPIRMGATEWSLIVLHSVLWGSSFFFGAIAITGLPPLTITAFRAIPACIVVLGVCRALGLRLPWSFDFWRRMLILGFLNNFAPLMLILWAQHQVASGVAAVFNATTPLFAVLVAHFATSDERITAGRLLGVLVGVAGVSVLVGTDVTSGATGGILAKIALLGAALCYALAGIFARRTSKEEPFVVAAGQMITALALAMPLALSIDEPWLRPAPSVEVAAAVFAMGLFGSAFAALVYFTVIKRAGATNGLLVTLLLPVTPIILGALFLGESLSRREVAGAAIIAAALLILDGRLVRGLGRLVQRSAA